MEQTPPIGNSPAPQPDFQPTPNTPSTEQGAADAATQIIAEAGVSVTKSAADTASTGAEILSTAAEVASAGVEILGSTAEVAGQVAGATIGITVKVAAAVLEDL